MDLKKDYERFAKQYKLPSYDDLNEEFELLYVMDVKEIAFPLRFVRRRMNDKIGWACNMLQTILQPNPGSLVSLHEGNSFSKEEKQKIFSLLRDLMQVERESLLLDIHFDERDDAAFIVKAFARWKQAKDELHRVITKMHTSWTAAEEQRPKDHYFG